MKKGIIVPTIFAGFLSASSPFAQEKRVRETGYFTPTNTVQNAVTPYTQTNKDIYEKVMNSSMEKSRKDKSYLIVIDKSDRKLYLYKNGVVDITFNIGLGHFGGLEKKANQGDGKTPEGKFTIGIKIPEGLSKFHKSLMINYPAPEDAEEGLEKGIIDKGEYNRILNAHKRGEMPEQSTGLGGDICIHGGGSSRDWTLGCIALNNEDIDYIFNKAKLGIEVIIKP